MVSKRSVPRLSCRELVSEFLEATRKSNGDKTARTYRSRLRPVLDFAERRDHLKRWPFAESIDSAFAVELRAYLHQYATTRNGRPNGAEKPLSSRQIRNILECLAGRHVALGQACGSSEAIRGLDKPDHGRFGRSAAGKGSSARGSNSAGKASRTDRRDGSMATLSFNHVRAAAVATRGGRWHSDQ